MKMFVRGYDFNSKSKEKKKDREKERKKITYIHKRIIYYSLYS